MPTLLLVEDEPSATRYLRSLIEARCPGFEVVDTAENGKEALAKAARLLPDIVITDIRMAVMDGMELAARLSRELPFIYTVILSGYQEFEYARRAIDARVVDYLLKPVNGGQLSSLLERIGTKVAADHRARRIELLRGALGGVPAQQWERIKYLPFPQYRLAALRCGGLPSRYHAHRGEAALARALASAGGTLEETDTWALPGRDDSELLLFAAAALTKPEQFQTASAAVYEGAGPGIRTLYHSPRSTSLEEAGNTAAAVFRALDASIVPGLSQVIQGTSLSHAPAEGEAVDAALLSRFDYLISNGMFVELEEEIRKLAASWETARCALVKIEASLRRLFQLVQKKSPGRDRLTAEDVEFLLDEALQEATSCSEIADSAWSLAARVLQRPAASSRGRDAPALLDSIRDYLRKNYADPVTLASVCEAFGVSQTYLSRLFRRHDDTTFNDFLTGLRIDAARKLIAGNPAMPLKDVAAFSGYQDQFYFSRVFKAVVGVPPSEFARQLARGE